MFCHFATGVFKQKATHRAAFKHLVYSKELAEFKCSTPLIFKLVCEYLGGTKCHNQLTAFRNHSRSDTKCTHLKQKELK